MDEAGSTTDQQPELEDEATPVVAEEAPAAIIDEDTTAEETLDVVAEEAPAVPDEVAVAEEPIPAEPAEPAEQLSLEQMVESLKEDEPPTGEPESGEAPTDEVAETAPTVVSVTAEEPLLEGGLTRDRLAARLPFGLYIGVWAIFAGAMTYLLWPLAVKPFTGTQLYAYFVLGGVALTLVGPLLGLGVWLAVRGRAEVGGDAGLARAAFMRAAAATLAGDLLWWIGLVLLDLHRAGMLG
jgi:hypothetical protein